MLGLGVAVLAISSATAAIKLADPLAPEVVACLRVSVTVIGLALLGPRASARAVRALLASPRDAGLTALAGLCLAAHFAAWITSLSLTSVVRSLALVSTQPFFAGLLARAIGDRAPSRRLYVGSLVAIVGTVLMIEPGDASGALLGDLLALSGAITAAMCLVLGRRIHARLGDALPLDGYLVCVNVVAAACLGVFVLVRGSSFVPDGVEVGDYLAVVWLGLVPGIVGHGLLNWAVRKVPVHTVSLAVLLEPAGAALLAWALLGESVGGREAVGAAVLLGGVALGLPRRE
ncbi:MAG TPA: EamA family transporter [Enhygromyxa sp.]|nr:EamA family transporter [Enhygromyxa sp.]